VDLKDIAAEDWTLNISRYVLPPLGADIPPLDVAVRDFKVALERAREAEDELRRVMLEGGWLDSN
jgi:type I restriction enzyme M protein